MPESSARYLQALQLFEEYREHHDGEDHDAERMFLGRHPELRDLLEPMFRIKGAIRVNRDEGPVLEGAFSHFQILQPLGQGGMGQVYRARDLKLDREVALKVLPPEFTADEERRARFLRESMLAAKLLHPNIATVYEANEVDGRLYYTMELLRGDTLKARVRAGGLPMDELLRLAIPIAEGLAEAHRQGVVHRDLKPGNIMVNERGQPKILDFGLSRGVAARSAGSADLTASGQLLGTPQYMSPEQVRGKDVNQRSDLFSLGAVLYELACGVRPFHGETGGQVMEAVLHQQPPPVQRGNPRIDDRMAQLIVRLLEKDEELRLQTADDLLAALKELQRPKTQSRRRLWIPMAAAIVLLSLILLWTTSGREDRPSLAILPFAVPEGDAGAEAIASTLLYNLPQALVSGDIEIIPASYLTSMARRVGTTLRAEDQVAEAELARSAGADLMVVGRVLPLDGSFQVVCELVDVHENLLRDAHSLSGVRLATVAEDVDNLAVALQETLGIGEAGLRMYSEEPEAWISFALGQQAMDLGAWVEAADHFSAAIAADPDFAMGYYNRAWAWVWLEESTSMRAAEDDLDRALEHPGRLTPDDREKAAILREAVRTFWQAPGVLERARRFAVSRPRDAEAQRLWMEFAVHSETESTPREAVAACQSLRDARPESVDANFHLMIVSAWTGQTDLVREAARTLLEIAPDYPFAGSAYLLAGEQQKALDFARSKVEGSEIAMQWFSAVEVAAILGDSELLSALSARSWDGQTLPELVKAYAHAARGDFVEARNILSSPFDSSQIPHQPVLGFAILHLELGMDPRLVAPGDAAVEILRAVWLARQGRPEEAEQVLEARSPTADRPHVRRLVTFAEGEIATARGQRDIALAKFRQAAPDPGEVENYWVGVHANLFVERLGRALVDAGQFEEAERFLRRFEEEPELLKYQSHLSLVVFPNRALYNLGRCREAAGDTVVALDYYTRFLSRWSTPDAGFPEVADALSRYEGLAGEPWSQR